MFTNHDKVVQEETLPLRPVPRKIQTRGITAGCSGGGSGNGGGAAVARQRYATSTPASRVLRQPQQHKSSSKSHSKTEVLQSRVTANDCIILSSRSISPNDDSSDVRRKESPSVPVNRTFSYPNGDGVDSSYPTAEPCSISLLPTLDRRKDDIIIIGDSAEEEDEETVSLSVTIRSRTAGGASDGAVDRLRSAVLRGEEIVPPLVRRDKGKMSLCNLLL